jgi:hypothetical protein
VERKIQASAQTLPDIKFTPNSLHILLHFSFDILTVVTICCRAAVQAFSKIQEEEFFWFGKNSQTTSDKLHSALYTFTVAALHT